MEVRRCSDKERWEIERNIIFWCMHVWRGVTSGRVVMV